MKSLLVLGLVVTTFGAVSLVQASPSDPCEKAAHNFAVKQQHEDYKGKDWKEAQPADPTAELEETKSKGFELWTIEYNVDEECLEGYELLVRRSNDGKRCAVIKKASDTNRDCG